MSTDHPPAGGPLRLQPMVHVEDMAAAVAFYEQLGGRVRQGSRDGDWVLLALPGGEISLLAHPPNPDQDAGAVELNFQAEPPLEQVEDQLRRAGITIVAPVTGTGFGRQFQIASPDGLLIKLNEIRPSP